MAQGAAVSDIETTAEAYAALPKAKRVELKWSKADQAGWVEWHASIDGEKLPARIRELDKKTFSVYRCGKYLGSEGSLDEAKKRAVLNAKSQKNRVMRAWEEAHPDEIPPFLLLTEAERAEYRRMHPGGRAITEGTVARPPRRGIGGGDAGDDSDPGTRRLREQLAKPDSATTAAPKDAASPRTKGGNKTAVISALLTREGGCTSQEVLDATGWTAVSMPQQAKVAGLVLKVDKGRKPFRYYGKEGK